MTRGLTLLAAGSLAGGFARYGLGTAVYRLAGTAFPYGTLAVNTLGCLVIGALDAVVQGRQALGPDGRLFLMTGFCGAFTTFSALILETENFFRAGQFLRGSANLAISLILGILAFRLGWRFGRFF